jgi:hypothetical protein
MMVLRSSQHPELEDDTALESVLLDERIEDGMHTATVEVLEVCGTDIRRSLPL